MKRIHHVSCYLDLKSEQVLSYLDIIKKNFEVKNQNILILIKEIYTLSFEHSKKKKKTTKFLNMKQRGEVKFLIYILTSLSII